MSEVEVAKALGVSRQPVRDAFYRLSKLGFLSIRPQRATLVSQISSTAVLQARFVRNALEAETVRTACRVLTSEDHAALDEILEIQRKAVEAKDPVSFHGLDDQFHRKSVNARASDSPGTSSARTRRTWIASDFFHSPSPPRTPTATI
jgi:DNA-binding GntR family transcriptional regulator